jgi:catechol 2,3-dioxygenase-like lactoylglutathione lyase family enzyme
MEPTQFATPRPEVDTEIYGMPMFVTLAVTDLGRSRAFYAGTLDFVELAALPGPDGATMLVHLRRWRHQDILLVPARGPVDPGRGAVLSIAGLEDQLAGLAQRVTAGGVGAAEGPVDTAWNTCDLMVTDPDGYRLTYTARRPVERRDADFEARMRSLPR